VQCTLGLDNKDKDNILLDILTRLDLAASICIHPIHYQSK